MRGSERGSRDEDPGPDEEGRETRERRGAGPGGDGNPFRPPTPREAERKGAAVVLGAVAPGEPAEPVMILPQVHLRKPCYDFYFL